MDKLLALERASLSIGAPLGPMRVGGVYSPRTLIVGGLWKQSISLHSGPTGTHEKGGRGGGVHLLGTLVVGGLWKQSISLHSGPTGTHEKGGGVHSLGTLVVGGLWKHSISLSAGTL